MESADQTCGNFTCASMPQIYNSSGVQEKIGFKFETEFDYRVTKNWMGQNWTLGFYLVGVYLVVIFGIQNWMKNRPRFNLQGYLVTWSFLLAGFSIFGTFRMAPEMLELLSKPNGFHQSVCTTVTKQSPMFALWTFLFVISKAPELGDTIFIVLRKQPLIFLHYYHHVTVLLYSWYSYMQFIAPSRWFVVMNFFVHALMYSYYGLRALKFKIPKPIAVVITSLQIVQMFVGVTVNVYALTTKSAGTECDVPFDNIFWALAMYGSYFLLFVDFFRKAYFGKGKTSTVVRESIKKD